MSEKQLKQLNDLKSDLEELQTLYNQAQRSKIKNVLSIEIRKLETEIININHLIQSTKTPEDGIKAAVKTKTIENKRYNIELKNYAWDQSDKFVKVFVTADGVQSSSEDNVYVTFTEKSLELKIMDVNNRDYTFVINNLLENIVVEKSYRKIKTDMVAIYLKKAKEGSNWQYMTITEKRIKDMKNNDIVDQSEGADASDPGAGLMNLMKKMYQSGDGDMKKVIAKAWTEAQDKRDKEGPQF